MRWLILVLAKVSKYTRREIVCLRNVTAIFLAALLFLWASPYAALGQTLVTDPNDANPLGDRVPLILIHGWCGGQDTWDSFREFFESAELREQYKLYYFNFDTGSPSVTSALPGCPDDNRDHTWQRVRGELAAYLKSEINANFGSQTQVAFLTHSLGGLIARSYMQERDGYSRTLVLITLATPHHGTLIANQSDGGGNLLSGLYWDQYVDENEPPNNWLRCLNGYAAPLNPSTQQPFCSGGALTTRREIIPKIVAFGTDDDEVVPIDSALLYNTNHDDPNLQVRKRYRGQSHCLGWGRDHQGIHEPDCPVTDTSDSNATQTDVFTAITTELAHGLSNDAPVGNLSGPKYSTRHFKISVPSGASSLSVTITGGSGDADLYVRQGARPSLMTYLCRPYLNGNDETCTFTNPASGEWFMMLRGYTAYNGVTLRAKHTLGPVCTYSISPTSQSVGAGGGNGSVVVTASNNGCSRTASSNVSWITVTSGSNGSGNGTVTYSVAANTSTSQRSGTITIQGNIFTVTQAGATSAVTGLQNDVPVSNLSGAQGSQRHYRISVPSGVTSLVVTTTGGSGDVDLYVKQGTQASLSSYVCRPYLGGNNETCTFTNPASGDWYIMLNGYAAYSGVTLRAKYMVGPVCTYSISPTSWSVPASGGSGSVGVSLSSGCSWTAVSNVSWITITSGSSGSGNGTVTISVAGNTSTTPRTGTLTIAGKTFTVTQAGAASGVTSLQNNVPVSGLSGASGSQRYFKIAMPAGRSSLVVTISGGSGDVDLYVKRGTQPSLSSYDCRPYLGGNNETCTFTNPASGDWYIMLRGYSSYSGVTLRAKY